MAVIDNETDKVLVGLRRLFRGVITSPEIQVQSRFTRIVQATIESIWSGLNYSFVSTWSNAGQQKRYPGDKGFSLVGVKVAEQYQ